MIKDKKGFTLTELIVVIVIILVLAAVLVPAVLRYVSKANKADAISQGKEVANAAQRIAVELADSGTLSESSLVSNQELILKDAGASGEFFDDITYEDNESDKDFGKIISFSYLTKKNILVIFDINHDPQIYIDPDGQLSLSSIKNFQKDYDTFLADWKKANPNTGSKSRESLIQEMISKGTKLLGVSSYLKKGTNFENYSKPLYWHPYYLGGIKGDTPSVLFANPSETDHGGWKAQLVYVNGKIYQSTASSGSVISAWGQSGGPSDYNSMYTWLDENGFEEVKR